MDVNLLTLKKNYKEYKNNLDDSKSNNSDSFINEEEKLKMKYYKFKHCLYEKMKKKQYKEVMYEIENYSDNYKDLYEIYQLNFLKIEALLKIISHKIKKYCVASKIMNNIITNKQINFVKKLTLRNSKKIINLKFSKKNFVSIESYYIKVNNEIENLLTKINNIYEDNQVTFIEKIIQFYLKLYIIREHQFNLEKKVPNNFCYLSFSEKLIEKFNSYMKNSITLEISEKIFLLIAKLLIENHDFKNSEIYCLKIINLCFKELYIIYKDEFDNLNNKNIKRKGKVILNLCIAIFYIGICKENIFNITMAFQYYSLVEIIIKHLLIDEIEENYSFIIFHKIILSIKNRTKEYYNLFNYLSNQNKIVIKERKEYNERMEKLNLEKEEMKRKQNFLLSSLKMRGIEKKINKIEIPKEVNLDDNLYRTINRNNSSENNLKYKSYVLSNLRLLDDYCSKDFKETINSMEKIKLIDLDISEKEKIQKILEKKQNNFSFEQKLKKCKTNIKNINSNKKNNYYLKKRKILIKDIPKLFMKIDKNKTKSLNQEDNLNESLKKNNSFFDKKNRSFNSYKLKKISSCPNLLKKKLINKIKQENSLTSSNSKKIERLEIKGNHFELSNSYKNKKLFINSLRDRETAFLKKLLQIKSEEKLVEIEDFDLMKIKRVVNEKFNFIKNNNSISEETLKDQINKVLNKKYKLKQKTMKNISDNNLFTTNILNKTMKQKKKCFYFENKESSNSYNRSIIENINLNLEDLDKEKKELEEEIRGRKLRRKKFNYSFI